MVHSNDTNFVKRIKVKGYPRTALNGKVCMVSPHFRIIRNVKSEDDVILKRRKLI